MKVESVCLYKIWSEYNTVESFLNDLFYSLKFEFSIKNDFLISRRNRSKRYQNYYTVDGHLNLYIFASKDILRERKKRFIISFVFTCVAQYYIWIYIALISEELFSCQTISFSFMHKKICMIHFFEIQTQKKKLSDIHPYMQFTWIDCFWVYFFIFDSFEPSQE